MACSHSALFSGWLLMLLNTLPRSVSARRVLQSLEAHDQEYCCLSLAESQNEYGTNENSTFPCFPLIPFKCSHTKETFCCKQSPKNDVTVGKQVCDDSFKLADPRCKEAFGEVMGDVQGKNAQYEAVEDAAAARLQREIKRLQAEKVAEKAMKSMKGTKVGNALQSASDEAKIRVERESNEKMNSIKGTSIGNILQSFGKKAKKKIDPKMVKIESQSLRRHHKTTPTIPRTEAEWKIHAQAVFGDAVKRSGETREKIAVIINQHKAGITLTSLLQNFGTTGYLLPSRKAANGLLNKLAGDPKLLELMRAFRKEAVPDEAPVLRYPRKNKGALVQTSQDNAQPGLIIEAGNAHYFPRRDNSGNINHHHHDNQRVFRGERGLQSNWFWVVFDLGVFFALGVGAEVEIGLTFAYHFDFNEWSIHVCTGFAPGAGLTFGVGAGISAAIGLSWASGMNGQGYGALIGNGMLGFIAELEREDADIVGLDGLGFEIGIGNDAWVKAGTTYTMLIGDAYNDPWKLVRCLSTQTNRQDMCGEVPGY